MIRSMTGFGAAAREEGELRSSVSVRSVNHRFLEIQCQLPRRLARLEAEVKERVMARVARGRVEVAVALPGGSAAVGAVAVNRPLAASLVETLRLVHAEHGLSGDVRVGDIVRFPGVLEAVEVEERDEKTTEALLALLDEALAALVVMRTAEGDRLAADLLSRVSAIEKAAVDIESASRASRLVRVEALRQKCAELCAGLGLEESRLYQEIVRAVERHDVTEELERLRSHAAMVRSLVCGPETGVGKRLDFLAQEFMREANTIGSKAADAVLVQTVVELKAQIERFREQVQNAE